MSRESRAGENRWWYPLDLTTIRVSLLVLLVSGLLLLSIMVTFNILVSSIARNTLVRFSENSAI